MASSVATLFEYVSYNLISPSKRDYYSEESKSLYLSEDTLRELVNINEKKQFLDIRRDTIKPLNCIGVVKAGSINIQIFPKLFKNDNSNLQKALIARNLLKMLSYTEKLSIREINSAELNSEEFDFFEIFIYLFAKKLNEQIKSTQRREYVKNSEEINFVRGRIDTKRYTNPARLHIIPCNFYQFSLDNTLNRTLKYTCYLMSKIVTNIEIFRLLKSIDAVMDSVSLVPITISEIDRISFNRLNQMFEPFIRTCRIFLSNSTLTLQASEIENFSLLIPMETLFEEFIFEVLNEDVQYFFGPDAIVCSQKNIGKLAKREDGSGVFNLLPDIVVNIGKEVAIIDTKYKSLNDEDRRYGVVQSDIYQMYAYVTKTNAVSSMLLYPNTELRKSGIFYFSTAKKDGGVYNIPLYVSSIKLSYDLINDNGWSEFRKQLKDIVHDLFIRFRNDEFQCL